MTHVALQRSADSHAQRSALARDQAFIALDEPTASLDFGNQGTIMDEIVRLGASGHGVLFTTHDPNHALRAATRAFLLRDGTLIADGGARDVLTRENLEAIYRPPVRVLTDATDGTNAFLPG